MPWDEFVTLLAGLNGDTPLGNVVRIRSEDDKEHLKHFTKEEKRIRQEWRKNHRSVVTDKKEIDKAITGFAELFKSLSKGG